MRDVVFAASIVLFFTATAPAVALQASDTMRAWKDASSKDRSALLDDLVGENSSKRVKILNCLNETSTVTGHADLPIGEIAKACASGNIDQPV